MAQQGVVLATQDTTSLNYSTHPATENLGPIASRQEGVIGLLVHDTMAFHLEGTPLGLLDLQCWARDPKQFGKKTPAAAIALRAEGKRQMAAEPGSRSARAEPMPATQIVSVGDREADIYELFVWATKQPGRPQLLIRAEHNRRVADEHGYLWEQMAAQPVAALNPCVCPGAPSERRGRRNWKCVLGP